MAKAEVACAGAVGGRGRGAAEILGTCEDEHENDDQDESGGVNWPQQSHLEHESQGISLEQGA